MLADLKAGNGFRVSSSGTVEGFVQCMGDLNPTDCSSCLSDVVGQLKALCGSAAAADVFLAQCYARYWASGYYDFSDGEFSRQIFFKRHRYPSKHSHSSPTCWMIIIVYSPNISDLNCYTTSTRPSTALHALPIGSLRCLVNVNDPQHTRSWWGSLSYLNRLRKYWEI